MILFLTFVPVPFVAIGGGQTLAFEAVDGSPLIELNETVAVGASVVMIFAVNHTASAAEIVVVTAKDLNLQAFGFTFLFLNVVVGSNTTVVNSDIVSVRLNATQRAILDLQVIAPPSWPAPLPRAVFFEVHATTLRGTASQDLRVTLNVTP